MSETKFTPGPWSITTNLNTDSLMIWHKDHWRVCFTATPGTDAGTSEVVWANAHLIAAAPDLYEVVERTRQLVADGAVDGFTKPEWAEALYANQQALTSALRKARGES